LKRYSDEEGIPFALLPFLKTYQTDCFNISNHGCAAALAVVRFYIWFILPAGAFCIFRDVVCWPRVFCIQIYDERKRFM